NGGVAPFRRCRPSLGETARAMSWEIFPLCGRGLANDLAQRGPIDRSESDAVALVHLSSWAEAWAGKNAEAAMIRHLVVAGALAAASPAFAAAGEAEFGARMLERLRQAAPGIEMRIGDDDPLVIEVAKRS